MSPVRLYFVSVAPPWGGNYFWDETARDSVREGLFEALQNATGATINSCQQFRELRFFLTPMVKCPSEKDAKDHPPSPAAVRNCAPFLLSELQAARPERILALGKVPFAGLCSLFGLKAPKKLGEFRRETFWVQIGTQQVPLAGTYFPGNNRHQSFAVIPNDIVRILEQDPKCGTEAGPVHRGQHAESLGRSTWTGRTAMMALGSTVLPSTLECPKCGGRLRLIASIHDAAVIWEVLARLGLTYSRQSPDPDKRTFSDAAR